MFFKQKQAARRTASKKTQKAPRVVIDSDDPVSDDLDAAIAAGPSQFLPPSTSSRIGSPSSSSSSEIEFIGEFRWDLFNHNLTF